MGLIKTMLTVDFDFFVPEDPMWDIGHQENEFFLNSIWGMRPQLRNKMKTTKDLERFWERIHLRFDTKELLVSESHCHAYTYFDDPFNVILFDAHHDSYLKGFNQERVKGQVSCGTWLAHAIENHIVNQVLWVVPDWHYKFYKGDPMGTIPERFRDHYTITSLKKLAGTLHMLGIDSVDTAHTCRSGCWVAPWLDGEFFDFAHSGPFKEVTEICEQAPLSERWGDEEYAVLEATGEKLDQYRKEHLAELKRKRDGSNGSGK